MADQVHNHGTRKFCVYHSGMFTELNKISQFQSNTPFLVFISLL